LSDFVAELHRYYAVEPCILCGSIHPFVIHSYPKRKARNPETELNDNGLVVSAFCAISQSKGQQYTKRFLPDILVPGCVIRLDMTLIAVKAGIGTPELLEQACIMMGCIDERTAIRHVALATASIQQTNLHLSEVIAHTPETGENPGISPEMSDSETLKALLAAFILGLVRRGCTGKYPTELGTVHNFWRRFRANKPSTYAFSSCIGAGISVIHGGQSP